MATDYNYEEYEKLVTDSTNGKTLGEKGKVLKIDINNRAYQTYLEVKSLEKTIPKNIKKYFETYVSDSGIIRIITTRDKSTNPVYLKKILDEMESEDFNRFLDQLSDIEDHHHRN